MAAATLRHVFGDLAPVAVTRPPGFGETSATVFPCPGRDFQTEPGDFATVLGTPEELSAPRRRLRARQAQRGRRSRRAAG